MKRHIYFALFPGCEIFDVAGPAQALFEAIAHGAQYDVGYCALSSSVPTAQGVDLAALSALPAVEPSDWIFVPGYSIDTACPPHDLIEWLKYAAAIGAKICSVCTGAFLLGQAGLLDGRRCTTHWKRIADLRSRFPKARVIDDRLYVEDGQIISSAGLASGVDMTIDLLEQDQGVALASSVAREMVVYMRRDGAQPQISPYLEFQNHLNVAVHQVQEYLIHEPASNATLDDLAAIAHVSARHLSRTFRRVTGVSIGEFRLRLRLELARRLLQHSDLKIDVIASKSGFSDPRQLRRLWVRRFGYSPSDFRTRGG